VIISNRFKTAASCRLRQSACTRELSSQVFLLLRNDAGTDFEQYSFACSQVGLSDICLTTASCLHSHMQLATWQKSRASADYQQRVICVGYPGMVEGSSGDGGRGREGPSPPPQVPSKGTWRLVVEGGGSAAAPPSLTTTPQPTARRNASISALSCTNAAEMYADHHD